MVIRGSPSSRAFSGHRDRRLPPAPVSCSLGPLRTAPRPPRRARRSGSHVLGRRRAARSRRAALIGAVLRGFRVLGVGLLGALLLVLVLVLGALVVALGLVVVLVLG